MRFACRPLARRSVALDACLAVAGCVAVMFATAPPAGAARGGGGGKASQSSPLSLASEYTWLNPYGPPWCRTEDDFHLRQWSGSLNGSFSVTEQLCNETVDYFNGVWWDAGGIGLQAEVFSAGTLDDLAITSPSGESHHAVLIDSSTTKGVTNYHYEVCYAPSRSLSTGVGGRPLRGGSWSITLSGDLAKATYYVNALMTDVKYQLEHCPASEQHLTP